MKNTIRARALAIIAAVATLASMSLTATTALAAERTAADAKTSADASAAAGTGAGSFADQFGWKNDLNAPDSIIKSDKGGDADIVYDAQKASDNQLTLDPSSIERYAYWNSCVTATGTGFAAGEQVDFTDISPTGKTQGYGPYTADDNGKVTGKLCAGSQDTEIGAHAIKAVGRTSKTIADATLQVTANARETAKITIENGDLTQDQFIDQKIHIRAEGYSPNTRLSVLLEGPDGSIMNLADTAHIRTDADGVYTDALQSNSVNYPAGTWYLSIQDLSGTGIYAMTSFTIKPGKERHQSKTVELRSTKLTADDLTKNGMTMTMKDFAPFDAFDVYMKLPNLQEGLVGTARANGNGEYTNVLTVNSAILGEYTVTARSRTTGDYARKTFIVTDDSGNYPQPIEASITPDKVSKEDFGPEGKGVTVSMKNVPENYNGTITVLNSKMNLQRLADPSVEDGSGNFMVFVNRKDDGTITYAAKLAAEPVDDVYNIQITITGGGHYERDITVGAPKTDGTGDGTDTDNGDTAGQPEQGGQVSEDMVKVSGTMSAFIQIKGASALDQKLAAESELGRARVSDKTKEKRSTGIANGQADKAEKTSDAVFDQLKALDPNASRLYTASYSVPGVAVRADAAALNTLAGQSNDIVKVSPIVQRFATTADTQSTTAAAAEPANANNDTIVDARKTWVKTGRTGKNVNIAIIDTGIDYTHVDFGGTGNPIAYRTAQSYTTDPLTDPYLKTLIDPAKYKGGYDFAGATYNANSSAADTVYNPFPAPDANPIDGPGGGHGTHVAGTAAGYGENADKTTFKGDYTKLTDDDLQKMEIGPGAAPEAGIYMLKVFGDNGGATDVTGAALDWVAEKLANNVDIDVVSMSLGTAYGAIDDPDSAKIEKIASYGTLSIAAAGNDGDITDIGGSPASTPSALAVAASQSGGSRQDAIKVDAPNDLAGQYAGQYSQYFPQVTPTYSVTGKVVKVADPDNLTGCSPYSDEDAARVKGNIAYVAWDDSNVLCGSGTRFDNAYNAGAIGIVFASQGDVLESGIAGNYSIPGFQMTKTTADKLKPALDAGTLEITLSSDYAHTVKANYPSSADTIASFTSRGVHGSYDGTVKPDVAAPGVGVVSAGNGTGTELAIMSGTSMATPLTSGVAALVLEAHSDWSGPSKATNLKAQLINTAAHDVTTAGDASGKNKTAYGPLRVGSGRIDAYAAVNNDVRVAAADDIEGVTASFGIVQVGKAGVTRSKKLTVTNDSDVARTYKVAYAARTETPGVTYTLDKQEVTVAAHGTADVIVTLNIPDASKLRHTLDKTMDAKVGGLDRSYVTDATGVVTFTPVSDSDQTDTGDQTTGAFPLRVSVVAAPKPVTETTTEISFADADAKQGELKVSGHGVNQGDGSEAYVGRLGAFQLGATDPVDVYGNEQDLTAKRSISAADIRAVGAATTAPQLDDPSQGYLAFGIQTQQSWSRLGTTVFPVVYFDVSGDGRPDFVTTVSTSPYGSSADTVYAVTSDVASNSLADIEPIDDASISDSNTLVLPVKLANLGYTATTTATTIRYQVSMQSIYAAHDDADANYRKDYVADTASQATFDVYHPDLWFGEAGGQANGTLLQEDKAGAIAAHRGESATAKDAKALVLHLRGGVPDVTGSAPTIDAPVVNDGGQKPAKTDKSKLKDAIAKAEKLNAADYESASWNALTAALESAKRVDADATAQQGQIDDATAALLAAIDGLRKAGPGDQHGGEGIVTGGDADTAGRLPITGAGIAALIVIATMLAIAGAGVAKSRFGDGTARHGAK